MDQKTPDFFLIGDKDTRKAVFQEHQEDLKNDSPEDQKKAAKQAEEAIQDDDRLYTKRVLKHLLESKITKAQILTSVEEIMKSGHSGGRFSENPFYERLSQYDMEYVKSSLTEAQEEIISERNNKAAKEKITESSFRCFKECLCPVCYTFACPFHTPIDRQDGNDDGQELEEIPYNPFILEESFKRVKIYAKRKLDYQEEILLQENKIFFNISERLKRQRREENPYSFKCKNFST